MMSSIVAAPGSHQGPMVCRPGDIRPLPMTGVAVHRGGGGDVMDTEPLQQLSESECWALLRDVDVARLATSTPDGGVDVFPVNHVVDRGSIVFRTAVGTKLSNALEAREVVIEADNAAGHADD